MNKNVISILDGGTGSSGKGKVIGEIATDENINLTASVTNCMPNAGHTFVGDKKRVFKNIPVSIVNPNTELFIGPGSVIEMDSFINEYESNKDLLNGRKIYIHELVPIISKKNINEEKNIIKTGSTFSGSGSALASKVLRQATFFNSYKDAIVISNDEWLEKLYLHILNENSIILLEGSQGSDLSLNHSGNYPYTTSRNVSTGQSLADSGISPERLLKTILVIRPFPIRINNISYDNNYINTGVYGKGDELSWSHINYSSSKSIYPQINMFDEIDHNINEKYIRNLVNHLSKTDIMQILKNDYNKSIKINDALEIERLFFKKNEESTYFSEILNDYITDLSENTTVTSKERRIFDLDIDKLKTTCLINTPKEVYLNFFQHLDQDFLNICANYNEVLIPKYIREYLNWIEIETNTDIISLGTGSKNNQRIKKRDFL